MIRGSAESYGVQYKIDVMGMATDIHSDSALSDMLEEEAKKVPTVKKVFDINSCTGSEDCSLLMKTVQNTAVKPPSFTMAATTTATTEVTLKFKTQKVCPKVLKSLSACWNA